MWLLPLCPDLAGGQTVTQCTGGRSVPSWQGRSPCFCGAAASQGHPLTSLTWDGGLWMQIFAGVSRNTHSLCPASHSLRLSGSCRRLRTGCPGLKESRQSVTDVGFYLLSTLQVYIDYVKIYGGPEVQITTANRRSQETAKRKNNDKNINVTANKTQQLTKLKYK